MQSMSVRERKVWWSVLVSIVAAIMALSVVGCVDGAEPLAVNPCLSVPQTYIREIHIGLDTIGSVKPIGLCGKAK